MHSGPGVGHPQESLRRKDFSVSMRKCGQWPLIPLEGRQCEEISDYYPAEYMAYFLDFWKSFLDLKVEGD